MNRRVFLVAGGLLAAPLVAGAQQPGRCTGSGTFSRGCLVRHPLKRGPSGGLMSAITARQGRMTDWQAIGQEVGKRPEPLFALGAPEIVFGFYLDRPVLGTPDYQTFACALLPSCAGTSGGAVVRRGTGARGGRGTRGGAPLRPAQAGIGDARMR